MAELSEDVKQFIVQALACYDSPTTVSEALKAEFDLVVPRQQVERYDPTKHAGKHLSQKWRTVFAETREAWKRGVAEIPIANRMHRLRALERIAVKAERMRNLPLALQVYEQAAKEVGDVFVNRRTAVKPAGEAPGQQGPSIAAPEYVIRPDEDVPDKPIL